MGPTIVSGQNTNSINKFSSGGACRLCFSIRTNNYGNGIPAVLDNSGYGQPEPAVGIPSSGKSVGVMS
jgi:hypothetical protein